MAKINKIDIFLYAKLQGIVVGLIGLVCGVLYATIGTIIDMSTIGLNAGTALAYLAIIGMPLVFVSFGFASGLLGALLFNCFSKWLGFVKLNLEK